MLTDRMESFDPHKLSGDAKRVHDQILAKRGYLPGPYPFWLASPGFAEHIEPLEEYLRAQSSLPDTAIEVLVLVCARHWRASYVWTAHVPPALKAGVEQSVIDAILTGEMPASGRAEDLLCCAFCQNLLSGAAAHDTLWQRANETFGAAGVNELFGLIGLYTTVCLTMVGYRMPTKNGEPDPFDG